VEGKPILIDMGISAAKLEKALAVLNFTTTDLQAILVTHAHSDHVKGLKTLLKRFDLPVYLKEETYRVAQKKKEIFPHNFKVNFIEEEYFNIGPVQVQTFRLPHQGWLMSGADEAGAHIGFKFTYKDSSIGYFTDLGKMPEEVYDHIYDCDYYLLEANHDVLWQRNSKRPQGVIQRNLRNFGHLSNAQAGEVLSKVIVPKKEERRTKGIMLAHLSRDCNNPILAEDTILKTLTNSSIDPINITFAPYDKPSEVIQLA
jgi:phosphoribosyl 1,2-cyclic phosphodiesterase